MGRKYCFVKTCLTCPESKSESFHRLPRTEDRQIWLEFISEANKGYKYNIPEDAYICSKHFLPCCYSNKGPDTYRKILKGHFPSHCLHGTISTSVKSKCFEDVPAILNHTDGIEAKLLEKEVQLKKANLRIADLQSKYDEALKELHVLRQKVKRNEESRKRKIEENDNLRIELKTYKKQKMTESVPKSTDVAVSKTNDAKTGIVRLFIEILQRKTQYPGMKYPDLIRELAFQLHYYSPRAYNFLRDELEKLLPHPRSFTRWLKFIVTKPGLIPVSLDFIRSRNTESSHRLYYSLALDEINIRQQIVLDNNLMKGYVDYGGIAVEVSHKDVAKTALFILACEINGNKKVPLGYILTNGLSADLMSAVVKKSLMAMDDVDAKVISITFDGLKSNMAAMELLGANLQIQSKSFQPYIYHPSSGDKVFIILDPCHMLKLMRNTLKACDHFLDANGNKVEWKYFHELVLLQEKSGLRAANKLTRRHTQFENQKMKVNLMTQTLSNSVKTALDVCRLLQITEFVGSEQTSYFVGLTDRLFDSMNSMPFGKGFKAPLRLSNKKFWKSLFDEAKNYFLGLKIKNKKGVYVSLLKSNKGTCVRGLIICIASLEGIMNDIVAEDSHDLVYLPTYKLSQDALELLFSTFRSRFGRNDNPNALQLEHALKSCLCMNLKPSLSANCIEMENSSTKVSCLGSTATFNVNQPLTRIEETDFYSELPTFPDFTTMSAFINNVVVYISGFVGRKLMKTLKCPSCLTSLTPDDFQSIKLRSDCILLNEKNNGGLFVPSEDLIHVCKVAELEIRRFQELGLCEMDRKAI